MRRKGKPRWGANLSFTDANSITWLWYRQHEGSMTRDNRELASRSPMRARASSPYRAPVAVDEELTGYYNRGLYNGVAPPTGAPPMRSLSPGDQYHVRLIQCMKVEQREAREYERPYKRHEQRAVDREPREYERDEHRGRLVHARQHEWR